MTVHRQPAPYSASGCRLPGYQITHRLGAGGQVWAALCRTTGEAVVLRRLCAGFDSGTRGELSVEARRLVEFRHPHVLGLRAVHSDAGGLVIVQDRAAESLAGLLRSRGRLTTGETVRIVASLAEALAAAHAQGIAHGAITSRDVFLRLDGSPLLAGLGVARLLRMSAGTVPGPVAGDMSQDVRAVAALGAYLLVGERLHPAADGAVQRWACRAHDLGVPPPLASAICTMLVSGVEGHGAAEFADRLRRSCAADSPAFPRPDAPLTARPTVPFVGGAATRRPPRRVPPRRRIEPARRRTRALGSRRRRALLVALCLLLVLLGMGAFAGIVLRPDRPSSTAQGPGAAWGTTLRNLDAARGRAFARLDPTLLDLVYRPGSPMLRADGEQIRQLQRQNVAVIGLGHTLRVVAVVARTADAVTLRVRQRLRQYSVASLGEGRPSPTAQLVPASPDRESRFRLVRCAGAWRIDDVTDPGG